MNREIKFRAWDKELGKMIFQKDFINGDNDDRSKWCEIVMDIDEDEYVIMQYTGLKDMNDRDIYEGDIVLNNWNKSEEVIEDIRSIDWLLSDGFLAGQEADEKLIDAEIIGNIYENSNLVK